MLTKLGQRNHEVRENPGRYDHLDNDNDNGRQREALMELFSLFSNRS